MIYDRVDGSQLLSLSNLVSLLKALRVTQSQFIAYKTLDLEETLKETSYSITGLMNV
jgi:hypothetical protein